jgi:hypothetical protein
VEEDKLKDEPLKSADTGGDPSDPATSYIFGTAAALVTGAVLLPTASDLATGALIQPAASDRSGEAVPQPSASNLTSEGVPQSSASSSVTEAAPRSTAGGSVPDAAPQSNAARSVTESRPTETRTITTAAEVVPENKTISPAQTPAVVSSAASSAYISTASNAPDVAPEKFAVDDVVGFAWRSMLKYFWPLTGILACNFLVQAVPAITAMVLSSATNSLGMSVLSMLISLVSAVLNLIIALGTITLWLKICDGDTITIRDVYSKIPRVWHYALATFLYGSMVILGYICLILPGVYLHLRFQFYSYFIAESGAGPIQSLKASYAITKGSIAELFFLSVVNYFIGWVGMMALLIGVFPAQVIQNLSLAKTYRQLRKNTPPGDLPPGLLPVPLISDTMPATV